MVQNRPIPEKILKEIRERSGGFCEWDKGCENPGEEFSHTDGNPLHNEVTNILHLCHQHHQIWEKQLREREEFLEQGRQVSLKAMQSLAKIPDFLAEKSTTIERLMELANKWSPEKFGVEILPTEAEIIDALFKALVAKGWKEEDARAYILSKEGKWRNDFATR